jgi:hypothetical protein
MGPLSALWPSYQAMHRSGALQVLLVDIAICAYRYATGSWVKLAFAYNEVSTRFSAYTFMQDGRLLVTGIEDKEHRWRKALAISVRSGKIQDLPSMRFSRGMAGLASWHAAVFVFGGLHVKPLSSCEQLAYPGLHWSSLPQMPCARFAFNPALSNSLVYLCGGYTSSVHIFDMVGLSFTQLSFVLPESSSVSAFLWQDNLVILTRTQATAWQLGTQSSPQSWTPIPSGGRWSNSNPAIYGKFAFLSRATTRCLVKVETESWEESWLRPEP